MPRISGVAGYDPGPRCADAMDDRAAIAAVGRCQGSAPALVARRCTGCSAPRGPRGVAGVRPRPSLRAARPRPPLLQPAGDVAGARPRPSLRALEGDRPAAGQQGALPGLGPGPRCARIQMVLMSPPMVDVARVRPRPSLRAASADLEPRGQRSVAGVRPWPSLRAVRPWHAERLNHLALPGPVPGPRCAAALDDREVITALGSCRFVPGPRCAQLPQTWTQVDNAALPGSAPALVARTTTRRASSRYSTALPGFGPGPRCALKPMMSVLPAPLRRCRGSAPAPLSEVRHHAPGSARAGRCRGSDPPSLGGP